MKSPLGEDGLGIDFCVAIKGVTAKVPTLCPMLPMKFIRPATAFVFSPGRRPPGGIVTGTNGNPPRKYCQMRIHVTARKLVSRPIENRPRRQQTIEQSQPESRREGLATAGPGQSKSAEPSFEIRIVKSFNTFIGVTKKRDLFLEFFVAI